MLKNMDPAMMGQISQALSRLPRGQVQKLQSLMQRAMSGKDVSREAAEFERTLPLEFQNLMRSMALAGGAMGSAASGPVAPPTGEMTEEEARRIVEAAAQQGKISETAAADLLSAPKSTPEAALKKGAFSKLFGKR